MITNEHRTPFEACVTCPDQSRCPIMVSGTAGRISVPKPHECVRDQLNQNDFISLCKQLDNSIGLNKVQYEQLGRQLDFVITKMEDGASKVIKPGQ